MTPKQKKDAFEIADKGFFKIIARVWKYYITKRTCAVYCLCRETGLTHRDWPLCVPRPPDALISTERIALNMVCVVELKCAKIWRSGRVCNQGHIRCPSPPRHGCYTMW